MEIFPNEQEIDQAADLLANQYDVSAQLLRRLLGASQRDQANALLQNLDGGGLDKFQVARLLVLRKGPERLGLVIPLNHSRASGSSSQNRPQCSQ